LPAATVHQHRTKWDRGRPDEGERGAALGSVRQPPLLGMAAAGDRRRGWRCCFRRFPDGLVRGDANGGVSAHHRTRKGRDLHCTRDFTSRSGLGSGWASTG
jgi:hypothetical protein